MYAVKGDGIGQAELSDVSGGREASPAESPHGQEGRRARQTGRKSLRGVLARAPRCARHHARNHHRESASQNSIVAAGSSTPAVIASMVRVSGQFTSLDDIRNVPIAADGRMIRLGDFTTIERGFEDPPTYTIRHNGQQVLMLGIVMTDDGNIVELGKAIETAVSGIQIELAVRRGAGARRRSAHDRQGGSVGLRAFAARSVDHRNHREPPEPGLAHRHRRGVVGALVLGVVAIAMMAWAGIWSGFRRFIDHRARLARGRLDHRR